MGRMSSIDYRNIRCELQIGEQQFGRNIYKKKQNFYLRIINLLWVTSFKRGGYAFHLMTEKFYMQFFSFKWHAASEDRLHTLDAANRIAYKFCKALLPRMWTRWFTALNVKKKRLPWLLSSYEHCWKTFWRPLNHYAVVIVKKERNDSYCQIMTQPFVFAYLK